MCRLLGFIHERPSVTARLLAGFRQQADSAREGPPGERHHRDGWGIVLAREGRIVSHRRGATNASRDPDYATAASTAQTAPLGTIVLAHLRNASVGTASIGNTHPFVSGGWAFAHNGTIHDAARLERPGVAYEGATDSERFFHRILAEPSLSRDPAAAIEAATASVAAAHRHSSLTIMMTDGHALYAHRGLGDDVLDCGTTECHRAYYALGRASLEGVPFITQEPTHLGPISGWIEVADRQTVTLSVAKEAPARTL